MCIRDSPTAAPTTAPANVPTTAPAAEPTKAAEASGAPKTKMAFVYVGPIGDAGWTWAHDQGRLALEKNVPNVETAYLESVPENPADAERVIRDFAQKGYQVIFTTSFGYMDPVSYTHLDVYKRQVESS